VEGAFDRIKAAFEIKPKSEANMTSEERERTRSMEQFVKLIEQSS